MPSFPPFFGSPAGDQTLQGTLEVSCNAQFQQVTWELVVVAVAAHTCTSTNACWPLLLVTPQTTGVYRPPFLPSRRTLRHPAFQHSILVLAHPSLSHFHPGVRFTLLKPSLHGPLFSSTHQFGPQHQSGPSCSPAPPRPTPPVRQTPCS